MSTNRREYLREYQKNWMARRRNDYLKDKFCVICGSKEGLEVDHRNPAEKETHSFWSWSEERRTRELAKCDVLCNACHKLKTLIFDAPLSEHGTNKSYDKYGCRCALCREAKRVRNAKRIRNKPI